MKKLTTLLVAIFLVACSADEPVTDLEGLKAMRGEWQAAFDAKDAVAIAALYTANGTVHPPNAKKVKSRQPIRGSIRSRLASHPAPSDTKQRFCEARPIADVCERVLQTPAATRIQ